MKKKNYEQTVKILMLGESGVGKSSLLARFIDDKFSSNFITTLGVEYKQKVHTINGKKTLVQVWDTAGQEKFRTITPIYYRKVDGVVMVFDITDQSSYESKTLYWVSERDIGVHYWMKNLADHADPNIKIILVGNKCDMADKRQISKDEGEALAEKYKIGYIESSAKNKTNLAEIFLSLSKEILEHKKDTDHAANDVTPEQNQNNIKIENSSNSSNKDTQQQKPCC